MRRSSRRIPDDEGNRHQRPRPIPHSEAAQAKAVDGLIRRTAKSGESLHVDDIVLCELVWVLRAGYGQNKAAILDVLGSPRNLAVRVRGSRRSGSCPCGLPCRQGRLLGLPDRPAQSPRWMRAHRDVRPGAQGVDDVRNAVARSRDSQTPSRRSRRLYIELLQDLNRESEFPDRRVQEFDRDLRLGTLSRILGDRVKEDVGVDELHRRLAGKRARRRSGATTPV